MQIWLHLRDVSWPFIELGIVAFAITTAVRTKAKGLRMLAAAAVLAFVSEAAQILLSGRFLYEHPNAINYLAWLGAVSYVAMLLALWGWGILAFRSKNEQKLDA